MAAFENIPVQLSSIRCRKNTRETFETFPLPDLVETFFTADNPFIIEIASLSWFRQRLAEFRFIHAISRDERSRESPRMRTARSPTRAYSFLVLWQFLPFGVSVPAFGHRRPLLGMFGFPVEIPPLGIRHIRHLTIPRLLFSACLRLPKSRQMSMSDRPIQSG